MNGASADASHWILAGGGHTHVGVLRDLARTACPDVTVTLVTPEPVLWYSGLLPACIAGHHPATAMQIDLITLARAAGARLVLARLANIDPTTQTVRLDNGETHAYDLLSLDIGSAPSALANSDPVIPVKPVARLLAGLDDFERRYRGRDHSTQVAVAGGGAGGIELSLSLAHRFMDWPKPPRIVLVARGAGLLNEDDGRLARRLRQELERAGIEIRTGQPIRSVNSHGLVLANGERLAVARVFAATGARAPAWLASTGLALDSRGFVAVDWSLCSRSHDRILAAGDIAALPRPRPKSGVFALREAPVLSANLKAMQSRPARLRRLRAPRHSLALISLGDRRAIAVYGRWSLPASRLVWWLKDRIDRRFLRRFARPA